MAAARLNIPSIVVSGGPMPTGHYRGEVSDYSACIETVGKVHNGDMTPEEQEELTQHCCPGCGSCSGMFTANSMNCLSEALGMALPGNGTIPSYYGERLALAKRAGMRVVKLVEENLRPRDIMTEAAFSNAIHVDMAIAGSTNTTLHLPAIANELGIPLPLKKFDEISKTTPNLCHISPERRPPHGRPLPRRRHLRRHARAEQEGGYAGHQRQDRRRQDPGRAAARPRRPRLQGHPSHRRSLQRPGRPGRAVRQPGPDGLRRQGGRRRREDDEAHRPRPASSTTWRTPPRPSSTARSSRATWS